MLYRPTQARLLLHFLVNTPTIVATVDATLAATIVVLLLQIAEAPAAALVAGGALAILAVWGTLFPMYRHNPSPTPRCAKVPYSVAVRSPLYRP
jgi:hypothetical protein